MTVQRRVGAYAKLLANYASDDAIIAAGEKAELLFVRGLAFCATSDSDGYITDAQLARFVGAGMPDAKKRATTLVREGVWARVDGGYIVRSWLKIHPSSEEKGYKRKTDRERKRGSNPDGDSTDSEWNPDGIQDKGARESLNCSVVTTTGDQGTEQTTAEQFRSQQGRAATPDDGAPEPPSPFCSKHPTGTEKSCGPCGTAKLRYAEHVKATAGREADAKRRLAEMRRACTECDDNGFALDGDGISTTFRCTHDSIRAAS